MSKYDFNISENPTLNKVFNMAAYGIGAGLAVGLVTGGIGFLAAAAATAFAIEPSRDFMIDKAKDALDWGKRTISGFLPG